MSRLVSALATSALLAAGTIADERPHARRALSPSSWQPVLAAPGPSPNFTPADSHPCLIGKRRCAEALNLRLETTGRRRVGPPVPPTDYDAEHYDLRLNVDFDREWIGGAVFIRARSLVPELTRLTVDLADNMTVSAITRSDIPLSYQHVGDRLSIDLDRPFASNERLEVQIVYDGHPAPGGLMGFSFDTHGGSPIASTVSQPWAAPTWWPCKETPADKATAAIAVTVPSPLVAASNGMLIGLEDHGTTRTWRWETSYPIATYLICAAITDYARFSDIYIPEGGGTMGLEYFVYPEHYDAAVAAWGVVVDQLEYYRTVYGEYPFVDEKYGMAEIAFDGAMEHQTLTGIGPSCVEAEMIIAHELAHQWWGDMVTCATWHDLWLNEGFARYSEALWWGELNPSGGYQQYMGWLDWVEPGGFPGSVYQYDLTDPGQLFSPTVYDKGAWVVHMLRWVLGDERFFAGLLAWREAYAYDSGTTEDLEAILEAQGGMMLDWFFDQWVYGEKRPEYEYSWTPDTPEPGQLLVQIAQVQNNAPPFKMPIPLAVVTPTGLDQFTVWDSLRAQTFVLDVQAPQIGFMFDPDNWVLDYHRETTVSVDGGVAINPSDPPGPRIERVHPVPFNTSLTITLGPPPRVEPNPDPVTLTVYDQTGRPVQTLMHENRLNSTRTVLWDGRMAAGRLAPSGVYFLRLAAPGWSQVRRIVRIR